jgi:hypothetical protein
MRGLIRERLGIRNPINFSDVTFIKSAIDNCLSVSSVMSYCWIPRFKDDVVGHSNKSRLIESMIIRLPIPAFISMQPMTIIG